MSSHKEMKNKNKRRVFFSYAAADSSSALRLRSLLSQQPNLQVFTTDSLSAGEDWVSKLKSELSACDIFFVLISPNSLDSNWVLYEIGAAWGLDKPIVPVVTNKDLVSKLPFPASQFQPVEIDEFENPQAVNYILEHYEENLVSQSRS